MSNERPFLRRTEMPEWKKSDSRKKIPIVFMLMFCLIINTHSYALYGHIQHTQEYILGYTTALHAQAH
jgi:hypothetical protein